MSNTKQKFGPRYVIATYIVRVRGELGCSMVSTPALAAEQADCYLSSRPAGVVDVEYSESCGHCRGSGRVAGRARMSWKPCPVCAGAPELLPDVRVASYVGPAWAP